MNGYAIFGRLPVFPSACSVGSDLAAHLASEDAAEARAEHVESQIDDAIDAMLDGTKLTDITVPLFDAMKVRKAQPSMAELLKDDGNHIDTFDDWLRILMRAPVGQLPFVALNFRAWAYDVLREAADDVGITELAEKMADEEAAYAREVAAEMRAGL
jgi:hypothetical protein